jgi:hypothetical protein
MPFIAKGLADGSTAYRSRTTGLRYSISPPRMGKHILYVNGTPTAHARIRGDLITRMERDDALFA